MSIFVGDLLVCLRVPRRLKKTPCDERTKEEGNTSQNKFMTWRGKISADHYRHSRAETGARQMPVAQHVGGNRAADSGDKERSSDGKRGEYPLSKHERILLGPDAWIKLPRSGISANELLGVSCQRRNNTLMVFRIFVVELKHLIDEVDIDKCLPIVVLAIVLKKHLDRCTISLEFARIVV
jgi:hypothetical protein